MEKKPDNKVIIPGNYQYNAINHGPASQRLWHLSKQELMEDFLKGKEFRTICDAGCGSGVIAGRVKQLCPDSDIFAYDNNQDSIDFATKTFTDITFKTADLLDLSTIQESGIDFIYSMEVIEHFTSSQVEIYLDTLYNLGHQNSVYLLTTPDYQSLWPVIEFLMDTLNLAPKMDQCQHFSKFTKQNLAQTIEQHNFKVQRIYNFCGMSPFCGHLSLKFSEDVKKLEKRYKLGNLICAEFTRGKNAGTI